MMKHHVLFALAACLIPSTGAADGTRVMEAVQKSIVYVTAEQKEGKSVSGSGVIVMDDEVLTNCHVIENAERITVQFSDGNKMPATVKGRVGKLDMCSLSAITNKRPQATIAQLSNIKTGQAIYAIGNPLSLKLTISDGIVSSVRDVGAEKVLQITAPISPGSSGGGVFDEKGKLLGLTTFTLTEGQNLNFAIPAEYRNTVGLSPVLEEVNEAVNFSFKGLPFGSSVKEFMNVYPTANCRDFMGKVVCRGETPFYLRMPPNAFYAYFDKNRLYKVDVRYDAEDSVEMFYFLNVEITKYFKEPSGKIGSTNSKEELSLGLQHEWYLGDGKRVQLQLCGGNPFLCKGDSVSVQIDDFNFFSSGFNQKDF